MEYAICIVVLMQGNYRHVLQIKAPVMHTEEEIWLLDLEEYVKKHKEFMHDNNWVQEVDSNNCLLVR